jgi:DNA-binding FadR family transcriptional regulator
MPPSTPETATRSARAPRRSRALSSDEIFERLLVAIMEHRLPPGTQLVEARLAAIFKVSRTKVREAIGRLVHDCIATNIPNRGAFVSSPTVTQAREVFAARRLIEPALVREVTHARCSRHQVAALRAHLEREGRGAARRREAPDHHAVRRVPLSHRRHGRQQFSVAHTARTRDTVGADHHPVRNTRPTRPARATTRPWSMRSRPATRHWQPI